MALKQSVVTKALVTAEYWYIPEVRYNKARGEVIALFHLFVDQAAREGGAQPVLPNAAKLVINGPAFATYFGADNPDAALLQQQAYVAAKEAGVISDYGEPVMVDGKPNGLRSLFATAVDV